ncbi:MAG: ATPase, T2SS/T4P/T4SS family [Candidatus Omnitrophota bacterium]
MKNKFDIILRQVLLEKRLLSEESANSVEEKVRSTGQSFKSVLLKETALSEEEVLKSLGERLAISFVNLKKIHPDKSLAEKIPIRVVSYYKFVPLNIENGVLTIAVCYPQSVILQDEIGTHLGYKVTEVLATEDDVNDTLKSLYGLGAETIQQILGTTKDLPVTERIEEVTDLENTEEGHSVIRLVNQMLLDAYKKRATDIHIEPYRERIRLRYRIDGILQEAQTPIQIKQFLNSIISRLKIMSNLNIVEHRLPQDGRAIVRIVDEAMNLRISCLPTPYGESVVIRLLPMQILLNLEKLGFFPDDMRLLEELVKKPYGIVFLTGPTGSGKTTTLYAILNKITTEKKKIITLEDPIEYEMKNITQVQVSSHIGLDFASGLRSMLRHDPDAMMVGEVRDRETAEISVRIALTGHLIFSTLHTNDAASGVTRLIDMGIEPYLITSSVLALIAQRLVRTICPHCKEEDVSASPEIKSLIAKDCNIPAEKVKVYAGKGCEKCNFLGYYGRTAIYEILLLSEKIHDLVLKKVPASQIKKAAIENGMVTLRQHGWHRVINGLTTPEEVSNATLAEVYE